MGEWANHQMNGYGEMVWPDKSKYSGQWMDNLPHGEGIFIDGETKEPKEGIWEKGELIRWLDDYENKNELK